MTVLAPQPIHRLTRQSPAVSASYDQHYQTSAAHTSPKSHYCSSPDPELVSPHPFRAWISHLMSTTGLSWRVIARAADVSSATVAELLELPMGYSHPLLTRGEAQRLIGLSHSKIAHLVNEPVEPHQLRILLWPLAMHGSNATEIAELTGLSTDAVRHLLAGGDAWVSHLNQLQAQAACEAHGIDPQLIADSHRNPVPATNTRKHHSSGSRR